MPEESSPEEDRSVGKYPISVASNLTGVPEHKLRAFEAADLIGPDRTEGGTRLFSDEELERIRRIAELADKGINYAGIHEILEMTEGQPGE
ncbi:MAG: MerR family transcriptional regulator [Chloroflexi bacterium]|nr:MerR family transcriptional regulator [Chloroflexota bacterium]